MNNQNNPEKHLSLELSLGLPQEQDSKEEKGQLVPQEQNLVEEHDHQFMQYLRSDPPQNIQPSPPPEYHMTFPTYVASDTTPWYVYVPTLTPLPSPLPSPLPPSGSLAAPSSHPPSGQFLHPPQANMVGTVVVETPRRGRPPAHHSRRNSSSRAGAVDRNSSSRAGAVDRNVVEREIVPPYPWATKTPAVIHTMTDLLSKNINVIFGQVYCRSCDKTETLEYNLWEKFEELSGYIKSNMEEMRQRAPAIWMDSKLTTCGTCKSEMKPVISENKEEINWLFLLLGQMLGCCTSEQLRFFCESTGQHRTGAKDRVLYSTYLGLYKQLDPEAFSQLFVNGDR